MPAPLFPHTLSSILQGFDPLYVYAFATLACGGLLLFIDLFQPSRLNLPFLNGTGAGYLVGPAIGQAAWRLTHRRTMALIEARDREFHNRIVKNRVDPTAQSATNPVPDFYGVYLICFDLFLLPTAPRASVGSGGQKFTASYLIHRLTSALFSPLQERRSRLCISTDSGYGISLGTRKSPRGLKSDRGQSEGVVSVGCLIVSGTQFIVIFRGDSWSFESFVWELTSMNHGRPLCSNDASSFTCVWYTRIH